MDVNNIIYYMYLNINDLIIIKVNLPYIYNIT